MPVEEPVPLPGWEPAPPPRLFRPWATWLIVGSTVLVFLLQLRASGGEGEDPVGVALGCSHEALAQGRWWTLFTYAWVHATAPFGDSGFFWLHIFANMMPLFFLGPLVERYAGPWRFLGLYLGATLAAVWTWLALNPGANDLILGASGAVFGVITAAAVFRPRVRLVVYVFFILPVPMNLLALALAAVAIEAAQQVFGWMPEVGHTAHLGGAAFGVIYALLTRRRFGLH